MKTDGSFAALIIGLHVEDDRTGQLGRVKSWAPSKKSMNIKWDVGEGHENVKPKERELRFYCGTEVADDPAFTFLSSFGGAVVNVETEVSAVYDQLQSDPVGFIVKGIGEVEPETSGGNNSAGSCASDRDDSSPVVNGAPDSDSVLDSTDITTKK